MAMVVGVLELQLRLDGCESLKDKRHVIRGMLQRTRSDFSVAAAETGDQQLWGNAEIGISCVSDNSAHAESILQHVLDSFDRQHAISVVGVFKEVLRF